MDEQRPGATIAPQNQSVEPTPSQEPPAAGTGARVPEPANARQYSAEGTDQTTQDQGAIHRTGESVSWTSSEFIAHDKSVGWYALLGLGALILAALVYLLTKDKISTAVIIVVGIIFGIFAGRKPREITYKLDSDGLTMASKFYDYNVFKSFSVVAEGASSSIVLLPLKRFMPQLTIYFEPKDEDGIVNLLMNYLPMENRQVDVVDRFMHRIKF